MNFLAMILVLTFVGPTTIQDLDGSQEIPELSTDQIKAILLFEMDGISADDIVVEEIKTLEDKARAHVRVKGQSLTVRLQCRMTDFGPRWDLDGSAEESIRTLESPAEETGKLETVAAEEKEIPASLERQPQPEAEQGGISRDTLEYQRFLVDFVTALRRGEESSYDSFFYKGNDFDLGYAELPPGEALAKVARDRAEFRQGCIDLSSALQRYEDFAILSVVATGVPDRVMDDVKTIMPGVLEFFNTAVIDLRLDGVRGTINLEGIARLADGWRVGLIADYQLPSVSDQQQQ